MPASTPATNSPPTTTQVAEIKPPSIGDEAYSLAGGYATGGFALRHTTTVSHARLKQTIAAIFPWAPLLRSFVEPLPTMRNSRGILSTGNF